MTSSEREPADRASNAMDRRCGWGNAGPIGAGFYVDTHNDIYTPVFYVFTGLLLLAGLCCVFIRPFSESSRAAQCLRPADASPIRT